MRRLFRLLRRSLVIIAIATSPAIAGDASRAPHPKWPLGHDASTVLRWTTAADDHLDAPFLIVDKPNARLYVFAADGAFIADAPVLLGASRGDDSAPGIGNKKLSEIPPEERTTPAGRFIGEPGRNLRGEDVVWVDYDAAVSMHRVLTTNPAERRLQRLATPTVADNRISWGCINVPAAFFDAYVLPIFANGHRAIIYVLPDERPLRDVFPVAVAATRG